jgi:PAS domain S-box-containing protein
MEQKRKLIENQFRQFRSFYEKSTTEEKKELTAYLLDWTKQQADSLGILLPEITNINSTEGHSWSPSPFESVNRLQKGKIASLTELQDLNTSAPHLQQIAENIEQVIWLRDFHSETILYVNPAFEKVWGISCNRLYQDPSILLSNIHPEDRLQVMLNKPHTDHKPVNQAYRILRPDGSLRWIFARSFWITGKNGVIDYQFCIAQDITNQKEIEQALLKTLNRTREQFDLSRKMSLARKPEMVLKTLMSAAELRPASRAALLYFNAPEVGPDRGVELTASWQSNQDIPQWISDTNLYEEPTFWKLFQSNHTIVISDVNSDPRLTDVVRDLLLEGKITTMVIFPMVASGAWLGCLLVFYQQERSFDHIELRHLKVLVDQATITLYNLKLLEIEEESRHEAERANEIKTRFLAMISHELRTPLTSIIGFTTTLLAEDVTWEPDEQLDFIHTIQREANRLQELIDHLLDLSRLEAGMLPISPQPNSLNEIVQDILPQINSLTSGKTLSLQIPSDLPQLNVDPKRIAQVLVNLVRNAATYSPDGTEIRISAISRGDFIQVNVIDQGTGITSSEQKKVFKAFQRGAKIENGVTQGAGLGLAICKGLIEAHGGRIWIKKKTAIGTTVCFTLPIMRSEVSENPDKKGI